MTTDFFSRTGKMAIGSRLRMLTDRITEDAAAIYRMYGTEVRPKWFPVLFLLTDSEAMTVTAIARTIGHSHPSVSTIVREMAAAGLVREKRDARDGRRTLVTLTAAGRRTSGQLTEICDDVAAAVEQIAAQAEHDLWAAIGEWERLLSEESLLARVRTIKRRRERSEIRIVPYEAQHHALFRRLNEAWITRHWQLEAADLAVLDHPQEQILDRGGRIFVALYREEPVGVCALCRTEHAPYEYELAKLAVSPEVQGKGIGRLLCEAVIAEARKIGTDKLFLESNTRLEPAIRLYRQLSFRDLPNPHPAYARGDIQMELQLV